MQGYDVRTSDGDKIGHVVDTDGDFLIVEHGLLKTKHALPKQFAEVDAADNVVRTKLPKDVIYHSPKIDGKVDAQAVAAHYEDAEGLTDAPTRADEPEVPHDHTFHPNLNDAFLVQGRDRPKP